MKFSEFIERFAEMDKKVISELKIRGYIPLDRKINVANNIIKEINNKFGIASSNGDFIRTKEVLVFFILLHEYTGIDISEKDASEDNYDFCNSIGVDKIFLVGECSDDYQRFVRIINSMMDINDVSVLKNALTVPTGIDLSQERAKMSEEFKENAGLIKSLMSLVYPNK